MDFVFSDLDIQPPPVEKAIRELEMVPENFWKPVFNTGSSVLPIFHQKCRCPGEGPSNPHDKLRDLDWIPDFSLPVLSSYIENNYFNWMDEPGRVNVIRTPQNSNMFIHYDCHRGSHFQSRPKIRFRLNGSTDDTFFLDTKSPNHRRHCPPIKSGFIVDGAWPHGVNNTSTGYRLTVAIGSPWESQTDYKKLLGNSQLNKVDMVLPSYSEMFLDKKLRIDGIELESLIKSNKHFKIGLGL